MEFNEKLQLLRRHKGITQQELADAIFVSRTAVSKWESARGFPNIESLKEISKYFDITVDELISAEEIIAISQQDSQKKQNRFCDIAFGIFDIGAILLLFLPFFGQEVRGVIHSVSLLSLSEVSPYIKTVYCVAVSAIVLCGVVTLALQGCENKLWVRNKRIISLVINTLSVFLFIVGQQPYGAIFLMLFLVIKVLLYVKSK